MTTPEIPAAALDAATRDVFERLDCTQQMAERIARNALTATLPHLLPGLFEQGASKACHRCSGLGLRVEECVDGQCQNSEHERAVKCRHEGVPWASVLAALLSDRTGEEG